MDENQIGPNTNTSPLQKSLRDGPCIFLKPFCRPWDGFGWSFGDNTGTQAPCRISCIGAPCPMTGSQVLLPTILDYLRPFSCAGPNAMAWGEVYSLGGTDGAQCCVFCAASCGGRVRPSGTGQDQCVFVD